MISTKTGVFVFLTSGEFKSDKDGSLVTFYKVGMSDEDAIADADRVKVYSVKNKTIEDLRLQDPKMQQQLLGKVITLSGRDLPKYLATPRVWVTNFKADKIIVS